MTGSGPVPAVPAATVVLLRPLTRSGFEVLLLRRTRTMGFAPGAHVFPGGSVDAADRDVRAAAVRETAEEAGIWLDPAALVPWARWITPEASPRRFDTWFFVAALPDPAGPASPSPGGGARPDGGPGRGGSADAGSTGGPVRPASAESDLAQWLTPDSALAAARDGRIELLPPTAITLDELSGFADPAAVLAQRRELVPRLPVVVTESGRSRLLLPGGLAMPAGVPLPGGLGGSPRRPGAPGRPGDAAPPGQAGRSR